MTPFTFTHSPPNGTLRYGSPLCSSSGRGTGGHPLAGGVCFLRTFATYASTALWKSLIVGGSFIAPSSPSGASIRASSIFLEEREFTLSKRQTGHTRRYHVAGKERTTLMIY